MYGGSPASIFVSSDKSNTVPDSVPVMFSKVFISFVGCGEKLHSYGAVVCGLCIFDSVLCILDNRGVLCILCILEGGV